MEYHAIEDAEAWHKIQDVLEERVKAGVEVRVFYDDMGSIGFINTDFVKKMERIGIHCRVFNPFMPGLELAEQQIYQNTIRLSIGTEHIDDIIADLEAGFAAVRGE